MSLAHSKYRLSCLGSNIVLIFLIAWIGIGVGHVAAQAAQYEGLVVSRATLSDTAKYYTGLLFRGYKDTGGWLAFEVGQKKPIEIEKGLIVKMIHFDNTGIGPVGPAVVQCSQMCTVSVLFLRLQSIDCYTFAYSYPLRLSVL